MEARRAFIELLKEGTPHPAPPLRTRRSLPDPSPAAAEVDEPRYWTFNRMVGEEGEGDGEAKPRPREMSLKERSTSGYWSYGSRWDLDEFDVRFEGGEGEGRGRGRFGRCGGDGRGRRVRGRGDRWAGGGSTRVLLAAFDRVYGL